MRTTTPLRSSKYTFQRSLSDKTLKLRGEVSRPSSRVTATSSCWVASTHSLKASSICLWRSRGAAQFTSITSPPWTTSSRSWEALRTPDVTLRSRRPPHWLKSSMKRGNKLCRKVIRGALQRPCCPVSTIRLQCPMITLNYCPFRWSIMASRRATVTCRTTWNSWRASYEDHQI